jgi:regulator of protease activity HflC (stomatin/prohibitin superfamily)
MSYNGVDRKDRNPSPTSSSHRNVVDHDAPHVTEEPAEASNKMGVPGQKTHMIKVQPLKRSEMQPSYAQDLGTGEVTHGIYGSLLQTLGSCVGFCGMIPCCPFPNPFRNVQQGSVGLVSRFGQFYKSVDPGLVQVNVCTESLKIVDVKIQISPIGRQTVITRDNVNVEIDSVIYFQICNPYRAAFGITDLRQALIERAQTTLRHVVGARAVQSVVTEREAIAFEIAEIVGDIADKWGVAIEGILIKDIIFSPEVSASLSSAAQQKRIGESKVIAARAEVDSARLMRQAADILASPAAMQIRQLEALQQMAKSGNSKVIFVPMQLQSDVVSQLANGSGTNAMIANEGGDSMSNFGAAGKVGVLNSMSDI